jgi:hypothetical protein
VFGAALVLLVHAPIVHAVDGVWSPLSEQHQEQEGEPEQDSDPEPSSPEADDSDIQDDVALVSRISSPARELSRLRRNEPQLVRPAPLRAPFPDPEVPPPRR